MNEEEIKENITKYLVDFLEVPSEEFGGFAPCPFAKAERIRGKLLISVFDPEKISFVEAVQDMIDKEYESGVFALIENGQPADLEDKDTRSFQKFLNRVIKEAGLKDYKVICINPNDQLDVNGVRVRGLSPYFLINVGLKKIFGRTHKSLQKTDYFINFPEEYKKYLKVK